MTKEELRKRILEIEDVIDSVDCKTAENLFEEREELREQLRDILLNELENVLYKITSVKTITTQDIDHDELIDRYEETGNVIESFSMEAKEHAFDYIEVVKTEIVER